MLYCLVFETSVRQYDFYVIYKRKKENTPNYSCRDTLKGQADLISTMAPLEVLV